MSCSPLTFPDFILRFFLPTGAGPTEQSSVAFALPPPKIRPFSLKNRRVVASYRMFDVLHHDIETAAGKALPGVYTFGCRDWCNVIPVTPNDEVVLIWQFRFGSERMELEIPGGVID